jgi:ribosomal protein S18 acetylase RimI-like enzyme
MHIRAYEPSDEAVVVALWERCRLTRPWNDPRKDIARKVQVDPELFLVGTIDDKVVASVMAGYEGHRGSINYLAVDPRCQRSGLGRQIMNAAERLLRERGCPKINLNVRADNLEAVEFYRELGYSLDDVVSMGKRLVDDTVGAASKPV